ncbi:hypothetical protein COY27_03455, partial [Candidatus Woesearchaeota archaeon CG_4_10_14_0_2_um_filter_33_13]
MASDGSCANWVKSATQSHEVLSETVYLQRSLSDFGMDYSGMSMFGKYDPSSYVYFIDPDHRDNGAYLAYQMSNRFFVDRDGEPYSALGCSATGSGGVLTKDNGDPCGYDGGGRCYSQKCLYPINGVFTNTVSTTLSSVKEVKDAVIKANVNDMLGQLIHGSCKSFPEPTAPFDTNLAIGETVDDNNSVMRTSTVSGGPSRREYTAINNTYSSANICQFDGIGGGNCSCEYFKVEYKNGTIDYWPAQTTSTDIPAGICAGSGDRDGDPCKQDIDCQLPGGVGSGICYQKKQQGTYIGTKGLCLEDDLSRPLLSITKNSSTYQKFACLTWLPIQVSASAYDLYNTALEAGYYPIPKYDSKAGGLAYCAESTSYGLGYYDPVVGASLTSIGSVTTPDDLVNESLGKFSSYDYKYSSVFNVSDGDSINGTTVGGSMWMNPIKAGRVREEDCDLADGGDSGDDQDMTDYYNFLMSGYDPSVERLYSVLQAWSWRNIGANARLLRMDKKRSTSQADGCYISYHTEVDAPVNSSKKFYNDFGFALSLDGDNQGDTGTVLHPPRLWNAGSLLSTSPSIYNYFMYSYVNSKTDLDYVETSAFSPEVSSSNDYVYTDKNVEENLNEKDINTVYFLPLDFPKGAKGPNPATLTTNFKINFDYLNSLNANVPKAKSIIVEATGKLEDAGTTGVMHSMFIAMKDDYGNAKDFYYVLERNESISVNTDPCQGLLSYCDYDLPDNGRNGQNPSYFNPSVFSQNIIHSDENKIYKRYVTLFYNADKDTVHPFGNLVGVDGNVNLPTNSTDPFQADCQKAGDNNWLAIGMDFNKDGEFLGYISRWCNGHNADGSPQNAIRFAVVATLNDICTRPISVTNAENNILADYNKAWTDRVWAGSSYSSAYFPALQRQYNGGNDPAGLMPFGSLAGSFVNYEKLSGATTASLGAGVTKYGFPDLKQGVPYSCTAGSLFDGLASTNYIFEDSNRCQGMTDGASTIMQSIAHNTADTGKQILQTLFKKFYIEWDFSTGIKSYSDNSGVNLGSTQPPKIFAIDYLTCDSKQSGVCPAVSEGFTINSRNYPISPSDPMFSNEDKDISGATDPIIAQGSYKAVARFYAYADDNRMPIKRVLVNWKDGSFIYDVTGDYQNRKPYCATTDEFSYTYDSQTDSGLGRCEGTQLTCNSKKDCKFVGPNNTAVLCTNANTSPSDPSIPSTPTSVCQYTFISNNPVYEIVCNRSSDCPRRIGFAVTCINSNDPSHSNECKYTPNVQIFETTNTCQTASICPDISGTTKSCVLSASAGVPPPSPLAGHFGDSARACIAQDPFEATHTYFCDLTNASYPKYTLAEIKINTDNMFGSLRNGEEVYN